MVNSWFLDWKHEHLLSCNIDGSESRILSVLHGTGPFDIVNLNDEKIAITLRSVRMIAIIEYGTRKVVKRIAVDSECYGIDHKEGKLLVRLVNNGIFLLLDQQGKVLSRVRYQADRLRYFTVYMDKIYCTITEQNAVVCMSMKGSEIWTFKNVLLREPFGIAVLKWLCLRCRQRLKQRGADIPGWSTRTDNHKRPRRNIQTSSYLCKQI